jgi:amino acid adenylation domain-containing protein
MTRESFTLSSASTEVSEHTLPEPLRTWNDTATDYPRDKTVAQLFEEVAAAHPDSIAVVFEGHEFSYAELNSRANRLAHRLRRMGVGPETMVGCSIQRSVELIEALIGVLKAGGAYVPLDPSYPKEHFDILVEDTHTPVMLTQSYLASTALAGRDLPIICVDEVDTAATVADDINPALVGAPTSLAYVMFTSGSTGRPKGVMVENRAIVRLVRNTTFCRFGPDESVLQFAPISFDASTLEIWGPLLNGGQLVLMPPRATSLEELGRVIRERRITTLWLTAGLFNLMVEQRLDDLGSVRQLIAGGDVLSPRHVRMVLENLPNCCLINGYGPTENTTFTCCYAMRPGERVLGSIPIGRPISNTQVYILDEQLRPMAPGQTGELYAGGDGVARGYLNNPDATTEKFVPNPFATRPATRMYRTGDLARWREDGVVEFVGRVDSQVKILGYRIEPGEVEAILRMHKDVKDICVIAHADEHGSKRLMAYYIPSENTTVSPRDLREFLRGKLPQYMVPSLFVPVASMPLSPNGKVDRAALAERAIALKDDPPTEEPATHLEQTIGALWRRILRLERIGLDDNFFDIGGDSLLLVAVHSNLQKGLQREITVTDLFEFTTVRTLAKHLSEKTSTAPSFCQVQQQAQKQREAFARARENRVGSGL